MSVHGENWDSETQTRDTTLVQPKPERDEVQPLVEQRPEDPQQQEQAEQ